MEWTYVAIYHLSLSTCVGGPTVGIIAIWEQLTVILSWLRESSSSVSPPVGTTSLEMTSRAAMKSLGSAVAHVLHHYQLSLDFI